MMRKDAKTPIMICTQLLDCSPPWTNFVQSPEITEIDLEFLETSDAFG